jgi:ubiquitin-protein ligase
LPQEADMNPRLRRLAADAAQMTEAFAEHPSIRVLAAEGNPPEKYVVEFHVVGLVPSGEGGFTHGRCHRAEIFLTLDYPRRAPLCRMTTPLFHPNVDPQKICIGDHWTAGQTLPQLVVRIAEMIAYQSYNTQSPLNAQAAAWAEEHLDELPLEKRDLGAGL